MVWPQHIHRILSPHKGLCDKGHTTLNIGYFISQTGSIRFMIWVRDDEMVKENGKTWDDNVNQKKKIILLGFFPLIEDKIYADSRRKTIRVEEVNDVSEKETKSAYLNHPWVFCLYLNSIRIENKSDANEHYL